jgi:quercetin dioxygenase-like cupin family protein
MKIIRKEALQENTDYCCINTKIKELKTQTAGGKDFNIKFFEMHPGGYSPLHNHPEQHQLIITDGEGSVFDGEKTTAIKAGDIAFITPNEPHQLRATGDKPLKFICLTI